MKHTRQFLPSQWYFLGWILLIGITTTNIEAQDLRQKVGEVDTYINDNGDLKMEVLRLRKKVRSLESKIKFLETDLNTASNKVQSLSSTKNKTEEQYKELERQAKSILATNDSINRVNQELMSLNAHILKSKENVEIAANALAEVLENERTQNRIKIDRLKKNLAQGCSDITHDTKRGTVVLDEENVHKLSWIDNFLLNLNTCYALPREEASNNIRVYFNLYRQDETGRKVPLENRVPVILTPNNELSDEAIILYEGDLQVALPGNSRSELRTRFIYEVEYQEEIIANGAFKLE